METTSEDLVIIFSSIIFVLTICGCTIGAAVGLVIKLWPGKDWISNALRGAIVVGY